MARKYDFEWVLADAVKAVLEDRLDADTKADCPVVTFYDPMAQDDQNRFIVLPEQGQNLPEIPGAYTFDVTVTVKSIWTQPTLEINTQDHRTRTHEVRNQLMNPDLATLINAKTGSELVVDFIMPVRGFQMDVNEQFLLSETRFTVRCHSS